MSERLYFTIIGFILLGALYIDGEAIVYMVTLVMVAEALFNIYIPEMTKNSNQLVLDQELFGVTDSARYDVKAKRIWRFVVSMAISIPYIMHVQYQNDMLWFLPWFMGFSIIGAGLSGVCPIYLFLTRLGFKR